MIFTDIEFRTQPFWRNCLPYLAFILVVLSAKLLLIGHYANITPYWDQWDAEADLLYRPWMDGTWKWSSLFGAHNEHRIFTTRILALFLFEINGKEWNPILQMQVNAVLHTFALSILLFYAKTLLQKSYQLWVWIFSAILFSIPFGMENTLAGFQSQFYFLLLFSFAFLWIMATSPVFTKVWWVGLLFGILSTLSLASGALTVLSGAAILILRNFFSEKNSIKQLPYTALIILMTIGITSIYFTPTIEGHDVLKSHSLAQFIIALVKITSWPTGVFFLIVQLPLFLFTVQLLSNKANSTKSEWFILALIIWLAAQYITLAIGRAASPTASRYQDIIAIGQIINFVCLLYLYQKNNSTFLKKHSKFFKLWIILLLASFVLQGKHYVVELNTKFREGVAQESNVKSYLQKRDFNYLLHKPMLDIPYPDPVRLKSLLDNPTIEKILPKELTESETLPSSLDSGSRNFQIVYLGLMLLGASIFVALGNQNNRKNND